MNCARETGSWLVRDVGLPDRTRLGRTRRNGRARLCSGMPRKLLLGALRRVIASLLLGALTSRVGTLQLLGALSSFLPRKPSQLPVGALLDLRRALRICKLALQRPALRCEDALLSLHVSRLIAHQSQAALQGIVQTPCGLLPVRPHVSNRLAETPDDSDDRCRHLARVNPSRGSRRSPRALALTKSRRLRRLTGNAAAPAATLHSVARLFGERSRVHSHAANAYRSSQRVIRAKLAHREAKPHL